MLIVNADDWGSDRETTDRTWDCIRCGAVSSVSAMVFMEDSERAAAIALEQGIDAGLHLNFTAPFTALGIPARLDEHQERVSQYLRGRRLSQVMFHPGLIRSFEYVVAAQCNEFARLYGHQPSRLDGHHHMHLCSNVVFGRLLPHGTTVRRNFSFQLEEKSFSNRVYRRAVDGVLARRHCITDFFFALMPIEPAARLKRISGLARTFVVEVETHPLNPVEHCFLIKGGISSFDSNCQIASRYNTGP
jgi:predicted glycoside hydrolase/deacetylase ChbG (UPF0249 family)